MFDKNILFIIVLLLPFFNATAQQNNTIKVTWVTNFSFGNDKILKNTGFSISYHWQSSINWQSPLVNGLVPAYGVFGAQITYKLPRISTTLKVEASDLLNTGHYQYVGSPMVGGIYYFTIVYEQNKTRS